LASASRARSGAGSTSRAGDLGHAAGALRPALLHQRVARGRERLAAVRFAPVLVTRPLAERMRHLTHAARLLEQLDPNRPLARGYVKVERRGGGVLTSAAAARGAGALTLHFADGAVDARVEKPAAAQLVTDRSSRRCSDWPKLGPFTLPVWFEQHRAKSRCARREPTHSSRCLDYVLDGVELPLDMNGCWLNSPTGTAQSAAQPAAAGDPAAAAD
jgi:hypothetical protein